MKKQLLYIILIFSILLTACTEDKQGEPTNEQVELSFGIDHYQRNFAGAPNAGTAPERQIDDLYLFLFPTTGTQSLIKFYIDAASFTDGTWSAIDNKIALEYTQAEVGNRHVYLVANCDDIITDLDAVSTLADLQAVLVNTANPWSDNIKTPLIMSGNVTHNFNTNYQLNYISLKRAVAKLQLNITLKPEHQAPITRVEGVTNVSQYKYKFTAFDKATYAIKPTTKADDLVSSAWVNWESTPTITTYTTAGSGEVVSMTLTTYLNERDNTGATVEISLPYNPGGFLPPPEFGDDTYKLPLPDKIVRNTLYVYDIEI